MAFNDFREPIEYVVNQYFERKKFLKNSMSPQGVELSGGNYTDETLPSYPMTLVRDDKGIIIKVIYGDIKELERIHNEGLEGAITIWQEAFIRDDKGTVIAIEKTYPDGIISRINIKRENDVVVGLEVGDTP